MLGAPVKFAGKNRFDLLVELETEEIVRGLRPDFRRLEQFPVRGVIVTSRSQFGRIRPGLAILRASGRHQRRPGLRLGALLSWPVLGREARPHEADCPPGVVPRRRGQDPRRRAADRSDRPRGDCAAR